MLENTEMKKGGGRQNKNVHPPSFCMYVRGFSRLFAGAMAQT